MNNLRSIRCLAFLAGLCLSMQPATAAGRWRFPNAVGMDPCVAVYAIQVDGQTRFIPIAGDRGMSDISELVRTPVYHTELEELIDALHADGVDESHIFLKAPCVMPIRARWMMIDGHFVVPDTTPFPPARHDDLAPSDLSPKFTGAESAKKARSSANRLQALARRVQGCEIFKILIGKELRYVVVPGSNVPVTANKIAQASLSYPDFESLKSDVML